MITKNTFRVVSYVGTAFFGAFIPGATVAETPKGYGLAICAGLLAGFVAARAYADQTASQDGKEPEPVLHG